MRGLEEVLLCDSETPAESGECNILRTLICELFFFFSVLSCPSTQTEGRWIGLYRILLVWYSSGKRKNELRV